MYMHKNRPNYLGITLKITSKISNLENIVLDQNDFPGRNLKDPAPDLPGSIFRADSHTPRDIIRLINKLKLLLQMNNEGQESSVFPIVSVYSSKRELRKREHAGCCSRCLPNPELEVFSLIFLEDTLNFLQVSQLTSSLLGFQRLIKV